MAEDIATERSPSLSRWQATLLYGLLIAMCASAPIAMIVIAVVRWME